MVKIIPFPIEFQTTEDLKINYDILCPFQLENVLILPPQISIQQLNWEGVFSLINSIWSSHGDSRSFDI